MTTEDLEEHIAEQLDAGIKVTADDFEGKDCDHCGETIPFADWPQNVVTWDIQVHDPDEPEPDPLVHRYYYCSEDCKTAEQHDPTHATDPDVIREENLGDDDLIADGGRPAEYDRELQHFDQNPDHEELIDS